MLDESTQDVICKIRHEFVITDIWRALMEYKTYYHVIPNYCFINSDDELGTIQFVLIGSFNITPLVYSPKMPPSGFVRFPRPEPKGVKA